MAENSKIEWCDHTGNLWWGCVEINEGCDNCYAAKLAKRWGKELWGNDLPRERKKIAFTQFDKFEREAIKAGRKMTVFVGSMMDIFEKSMPLSNPTDEWKTTGDMREELFRRISQGRYPNLIFLLLTKRPSNVLKMVPEAWRGAAPENVWIGITLPNRKNTPLVSTWTNVIRHYFPVFWSVEPLLENLNYEWLALMGKERLPDWIICGGESGTKKRPFEVQWAQGLLRFSRSMNIPFFMKQIDKIRPIPGAVLVREFPFASMELADE